jgi:CDP-diacylglycerol---glycerol-3-phosphate 3-phosphatidyltransferase
MLNIFARVHVARVADPVARWLVGHGVAPDVVTVAGTVGTAAAAVVFFPRGQLFLGALLSTVFVLFDMIDGAMARARGHSTPFGAVLDSTCDRIADGALFAALTWWCLSSGQEALGVAALVCLVAGQVISYVKARAEGAGLTADGGLVERPERLILGLVGAGFEGLGIPFALAVGLWLLAAGSVWTVGQRIAAVHRSARAMGATPAPPAASSPATSPAPPSSAASSTGSRDPAP